MLAYSGLLLAFRTLPKIILCWLIKETYLSLGLCLKPFLCWLTKETYLSLGLCLKPFLCWLTKDSYLPLGLWQSIRTCWASMHCAITSERGLRSTFHFNYVTGLTRACLKIPLDIPGRCAAAVKSEWKSVEDCMRFWATDLDDNTASKVALVQVIADTVEAASCAKCKFPKGGHCHTGSVPLKAVYYFIFILI